MEEKPKRTSKGRPRPKNTEKRDLDQFGRSPYAVSRDIYHEFQERGDREEWILKHLDEWSKKESSINIFDFIDEYGIPESTFYDIVKADNRVAEMHARARQRIGSRREKLAIFRKNDCNEKPLTATLRVYNKDWKQVYDEDMSIKKELAEKGVGAEPVVIKIERE